MYDAKTKEMLLESELDAKTNNALAVHNAYIIGIFGLIWLASTIVIFALGYELTSNQLASLVAVAAVISTLLAIMAIAIHRALEFKNIKESLS